MPYTITLSADGTYIELKLQGDMSRQLGMKTTLEAHAIGRRFGIGKYLVDAIESRNTDPVPETYDFAYKDMTEATGVDRHARVALLVHPEDRSHDFAVTVCRNAGFDISLFTDRKQAIDHLKSE